MERDFQTADTLDVRVPEGRTPKRLSVHALMDDTVFETVEGGRGLEFGTRVHDFAEAYADEEDVTPSNTDERNVRDFLNELDGELQTEADAFLPLGNGDGDGRTTLVGIVDLLVVTDEQVRIVDYKTDLGRHAESKYTKQLSVYYHVITSVYPDRDVSTEVFYTAEGVQQEIDPIGLTAIANLVSELNPLHEEPPLDAQKITDSTLDRSQDSLEPIRTRSSHLYSLALLVP